MPRGRTSEACRPPAGGRSSVSVARSATRGDAARAGTLAPTSGHAEPLGWRRASKPGADKRWKSLGLWPTPPLALDLLQSRLTERPLRVESWTVCRGVRSPALGRARRATLAPLDGAEGTIMNVADRAHSGGHLRRTHYIVPLVSLTCLLAACDLQGRYKGSLSSEEDRIHRQAYHFTRNGDVYDIAGSWLSYNAAPGRPGRVEGPTDRDRDRLEGSAAAGQLAHLLGRAPRLRRKRRRYVLLR